MSIYWIIFGVFMLLSLVVSQTLNARFNKYSKETLLSGMTGREVAEKMLSDKNIKDVRVIQIKGHLSDHYNPKDLTLNLSEEVYSGRSVAAAAVAAHECGHAIQHATSYKWLTMRSSLVPIVQFGANWSQWVLLAGLILISISEVLGFYILIAGIALFALTTIFAFVTLPVEYNASSRAIRWLDNSGITAGKETEHAHDALKWAARTYVVAALSSLATLLYYIMIALRGRNRN
ncbi:zinc metallopeptidase [Bacteroidales bacterium OttesenSCG-928-I21]|nr:zinc metallopeptidase [Bacteroidales bacterium OttesenSCG-928-I21]